VDLAHEQALQDDLVELGICSACQEPVELWTQHASLQTQVSARNDNIHGGHPCTLISS